MSYKLQTDEEIMADLAGKIDLLRRHKGIKDEELAARGGTNRVAWNKFRKGDQGITLKTFIRLLRGLDELHRLESMLELPDQYSPTGKHRRIPAKRVRDKKEPESPFTWGEDR
ncbi:MAG: hypothetical protein ACLFPW_13615 [Spirochaetaceae bacterium]